MFGEPIGFFVHYGDYERGLSSLMISVAMLGMGASLTIGDFRGVFVVWKGFAVGMATQIIVVPIWAGIFLTLLSLVPPGIMVLEPADAAGLAIGIALMAAMPGGSTSNLMAFLARGNVALSVTLTGITTFVCLLTTPIVVELLIAFQIPGTIAIDPLRIVLDIALFLIAPLIAGMVLGHFLNERRKRFTSIMVKLSLAILGLIIIGSVGAGRLNLPRYGLIGPLAIAVFILVMGQLAKYSAVFSGLGERDSVTITIEVVIKNVLLALLLMTTMFPQSALSAADPEHRAAIEAARDGCTYAVLLYGAISLAAGAVTVLQHRGALGRYKW